MASPEDTVDPAFLTLGNSVDGRSLPSLTEAETLSTTDIHADGPEIATDDTSGAALRLDEASLDINFGSRPTGRLFDDWNLKSPSSVCENDHSTHLQSFHEVFLKRSSGSKFEGKNNTALLALVLGGATIDREQLETTKTIASSGRSTVSLQSPSEFFDDASTADLGDPASSPEETTQGQPDAVVGTAVNHEPLPQSAVSTAISHDMGAAASTSTGGERKRKPNARSPRVKYPLRTLIPKKQSSTDNTSDAPSTSHGPMGSNHATASQTNVAGKAYKNSQQIWELQKDQVVVQETFGLKVACTRCAAKRRKCVPLRTGSKCFECAKDDKQVWNEGKPPVKCVPRRWKRLRNGRQP